MKIAYIGIDLLISALNSLVKSGSEIVEIFTCKTDNVTEFNTQIIEFANKNAIPYTLNRITADDFARLKQKGVEAVVCAGYYHIIPTQTDLPLINIHPSLLPIGRGAWPMPISILKGFKTSGVTIHKIAKKLDSGDILMQKQFDVLPTDNLQSFMKKVDQAIESMVPNLVSDFNKLYNNAWPQPQGEYWQLPTKSDCTADDTMSFEQIDLIFRAFYGYECYFKTGGKTYELIYAKITKTKSQNSNYLFKLSQGYIYCKKCVEI